MDRHREDRRRGEHQQDVLNLNKHCNFVKSKIIKITNNGDAEISSFYTCLKIFDCVRKKAYKQEKYITFIVFRLITNYVH